MFLDGTFAAALSVKTIGAGISVTAFISYSCRKHAKGEVSIKLLDIANPDESSPSALRHTGYCSVPDIIVAQFEARIPYNSSDIRSGIGSGIRQCKLQYRLTDEVVGELA